MNSFAECDTEKLSMLVSMLEMGMWDSRPVQSFLDTLDSRPELLLPHSIGYVVYVAFLLTKVDRHPLARRAMFTCLAWCIENDYKKDQQKILVDNLKHVFKLEGDDIAEEDIRRLAISRDY